MSEKEKTKEPEIKKKIVFDKMDYAIIIVVVTFFSLWTIGGWVNNAIQSDFLAKLTPDERKQISENLALKQQQEAEQKRIDAENSKIWWDNFNENMFIKPTVPLSWVIGAFIFGLKIGRAHV